MSKPTITDLIPDAANTNRHTERGTGLTRKSVAKFGPRKPIELDKDGRIIDGNSRQEIYADVDLNEVDIIDHTPGRVVAIRYPDFDLSDPANPAREYQVAQARAAQLSLDFDPQAMELHAGEGVDFGEWFFDWEWEGLTKPVPDNDQWGDAFDRLPDGDRAPFQQITFTLHDTQAEQVKEALVISRHMGDFGGPNENGNGNALARICELFITNHGQG